VPRVLYSEIRPTRGLACGAMTLRAGPPCYAVARTAGGSPRPPLASRPIEIPAAARAAAALEAGRYEEAVTLYREALRLAPLAIPPPPGLARGLSYVGPGAALPGV